MFATTQKAGMDMASPDVCKIPPFQIPVPFPNMAVPMSAIPVALTVLFGNSPAHNMMTIIPTSTGDLPGVCGGIVSQTFASQSRRISMNSTSTLIYGSPANRLSSMGPQNNNNAMGTTITPSCTHISILAG